jgi:biopolymer transport protein ExbB
MESQTLFDILIKQSSESFALWLLWLCSIVSLAVIIERIWYFFIKSKININEFIRKITVLISENNISQAINMCESTPSFYSNLIKNLLEKKDEKNNLNKILSKTIEIETIEMERNLGILGTIGNIAVYIGLFGTVIGVMKSFQHLSEASALGPSIVMKGISEALIATALGLFVAVISVIFYNFFLRKVRKTVKELNIIGSEIIELLLKL